MTAAALAQTQKKPPRRWQACCGSRTLPGEPTVPTDHSVQKELGQLGPVPAGAGAVLGPLECSIPEDERPPQVSERSDRLGRNPAPGWKWGSVRSRGSNPSLPVTRSAKGFDRPPTPTGTLSPLAGCGLLKSASCSSLEGAAQVNGFDTLPDVETIEVQAQNVAAYSIPQELLAYIPCSEAVIAHFKNGETERKIHCNIELAEDEQERLKIMREIARIQGKSFAAPLAVAATRYLARARNDAKKAVREMAATQEWRTEYFKNGPVVDSSLQEDLAHGFIYFIGRDHWLRPAMVLRPARIPASWYSEKKASAERLVRLLVFCIEYMIRYMLVPGKVEGGVILMDMGGLSLSQVPFGPLIQIITLLSNHYVNRIFKFFLLNLPSGLSSTLGFGLRLLTERQRQKVHVVRSLDEMHQEFALHQLEEDFGGSRPRVSQFFPWPLVAGPFEAGYASGPNPDAVPDVHKVFAPSTLVGRVWDPAASVEANTRLRYTQASAPILARCGGILLPPGSPGVSGQGNAGVLLGRILSSTQASVAVVLPAEGSSKCLDPDNRGVQSPSKAAACHHASETPTPAAKPRCFSGSTCSTETSVISL
mmetsp:Transcript_25050/g.54505  ORF Transcript_25050/g.54505 Transcript_25050/m.54505 type:complete len:592 (-) Transcript_25050:26-1801(-)